jgi:hypothetical protein
MKTAIVHDWLTGMRGGEKVLEVLCELYPSADLITLLHNKGSLSQTIEKMNINTSFIDKLPFKEKKYRNYLPLFPAAIESIPVIVLQKVLNLIKTPFIFATVIHQCAMYGKCMMNISEKIKPDY